MSQLDLLDAQRSELRNRRQALQVRSAQYQATDGGPGARARRRVGRMSEEPNDRPSLTGPLVGYIAAAVALVILLIA